MIEELKNLLLAKAFDSYSQGEDFIREQILTYIKKRPSQVKFRILDIGCHDGVTTNKILRDIEKIEIYGVNESDVCKADNITCAVKDIDGDTLPFEDNFFDIVYSSQVIEHMLDKDLYILECRRTLKERGLFLAATENIGSFESIVSLIFGQEPLSQHTSNKVHINSFFSPHYGKKFENYDCNYGHKNVCSYYSLKRLARLNGFKNARVKSFGNIIFSIFAPIYNRVIVVYGTKY